MDRFYLGHWRSALGKLFSFGGIGVWSIIDVILVATGYLTLEDSVCLLISNHCFVVYVSHFYIIIFHELFQYFIQKGLVQATLSLQ